MGQGRGALEGPAQGAAGRAQMGMQVAVFWGERLLRVENLECVRGPDRADDLFDDRCVRWVERVGGERFVNVPENANIQVRAGGRELTRGALAHDGRLVTRQGHDACSRVRWDPGEAVIVSAGQGEASGLKFVLRDVPFTGRVRASVFGERDFSFFKIASIALLFAVFTVVVLLLPSTADVQMDDAVFTRGANVVTRAIKTPREPEPPPADAKADTSVAHGAAVPAPSRPPDRARPRQPTGPAPSNVRDHGLLRAMDELGGGGSLFAEGGLGGAVEEALTNLGSGGAAAGGDGRGFSGLHARGTGPGGAGPGLSVGGGVGTRRPGGGRPGLGLAGAGLGPRVTPPSPEGTRVVGGLDRADIARVIKRHQHEIRFCYERSLQQQPDLRGKVAVLFVIDPTGAVSQADISESTVEASDVEACILQRLRRWRFPEPRGGGIVTVNFPWMFKPAGE